MNNHLDNRQIRIFISSTFQDMQEERDFLITKIFPKLQVEAAKRDVSVVPLDLRWGITEEEAESGKVIQICLQEIQNSRPFFIGLIGNRYGWCPGKEELLKNDVLRERWGDWLEKDLDNGLSVTEIEMQYGVLRYEKHINAYFYIKEDNEDATQNTAKIKRLKKAIRTNSRYPVADYVTPDELGKMVERDFLALLDKLYPITEGSAREKENYAQSAFMHSKTEIYVPEESNFKELDEFVLNREERELLVTGESGMGKSSLLANWIVRSEGKNNWHIFSNFIGNGCKESSPTLILQKLIDDICDFYHIQPSSPAENLTQQLDSLFQKTFGEKPFIVVLDGLNQIPELGNAKSLNWLPAATNNVKYIFTSTLGDTTMEVLQSRRCHIMKLNPLSEDSRKELTRLYLSRYNKSLLPNQVEKIIKDRQNENTFALRTMLDELVCFGVYELLDKRIDYYLGAKSVEEFFMRVLSRYEADYGLRIVSQSLMLIACSKRGLAENELLNIVPVKPLEWSQFYCAFLSHLVILGDKMNIAHQRVQKAILKRYCAQETDIRSLIIDYYRKFNSTRAHVELAYQYAVLHDMDSLYTLISNYAVFEDLYHQNRQETAMYWKMLLEADGDRFSASIYSDPREARSVNSPKKVNHELMADFFLRYLGQHHYAKEHFLLSEWGDKFDKGKDASIRMSSRLWYNLALSASNDHEALNALNNAVSKYEVLQKMYGRNLMPELTETNAPESFLLQVFAPEAHYRIQENEYLYVFHSYILRGEILQRHHKVMAAALSFDKALELARVYLKKTPEAEARALLKESEFKGRYEIKTGIELARKAYDASRGIVNVEITAIYNLVCLLVIRGLRVNQFATDEIMALCSEMHSLVIKHYGKGRKEYSDTMKRIAKIHLLLSQHNEYGMYMKLGKDSNSDSVRHLGVDDFNEFHISYGQRCRILGNMHLNENCGEKNIALAYFYLEEAKKFNALTNEANYEYAKMRRNEQIKTFTLQESDYDDEYLCKLLFPLDNISISDDYLTDIVNTEKLTETNLCKAYDGLMSMGLDCLNVFPAKNLKTWYGKKV